MAKKKQRKRKTKRKAPRITNAYDRHHLLWIARNWDRGALRELRYFHYCIVPLHRDTIHRFIHSRMCFIPPPAESSAKFVLQHLRNLEKCGAISDNDPIEKRLKVLAALFDCWEQPTADALRKQLRIVREFNESPQH